MKTNAHPRTIASKTSRTLAVLAAFAGCVTLGACSYFTVETPAGFVKLKHTDHPYKAVSAEGAVLAVRRWKNEPEAKAAFWAKVVEDELVQQRGYKLKKRSAFRSRSGAEGTRWSFSGEHRGDRYSYQAVLFVTESSILLAEAAAPAKDFPRYAKQAEAFFASFTPK